MVVVNYFGETHNMASSFYIGNMHFLLNGKTWFIPVVTKDFERQKRPDFCKNRCNVKPTFQNDFYFKMARDRSVKVLLYSFSFTLTRRRSATSWFIFRVFFHKPNTKLKIIIDFLRTFDFCKFLCTNERKDLK